jgi:GntR family transcriptional repressor for pyruvate dehydrogenase complex
MGRDVDGEPRSQTDVVVHGVREMILSGELGPGDRLPIEKDLAPRFAVSRGSLREGVRALAQLGILETRQGSGTFVTELLPQTLLAPVGFVAELQPGASPRDLQAVRRILETGGIRTAALRITDAQLAAASDAVDAGAAALDGAIADYDAAMRADMVFHGVLAEASGNAVLASLIEALASRTVRGRLWRALVDSAAAAAAVEEHREILAAVRARDPEAAAVRMAVHLLSVEEFLERHAPPALS